MNTTLEHKKLAVVTDTDYLEPMLNRILFCVTRNGHKFASRLIAIRGSDLVFQTSDGTIIVNPLESLEYISPIENHPGKVAVRGSV